MVKPSSLQAFAHRPALVRSKCGFENRIKNTFFIRSVSAYRELLIAAVLVVTIVQHRTSVLDKTACVCSKTSRVEHTKSVHNRPKPAVFVRTALGLSSNQNEVAINSKSGLWRTALLLLYISPLLPLSSARFLPPLFLSLRPCIVPFLPHSFLFSTLPPFLYFRSHPISHHCFLTPSVAPSLPHPPLVPSLPSSVLRRSCLPAAPNSMYTMCVVGKLY